MYYYLFCITGPKKVRMEKKWWGMVTSRRALDAALVHDDLTTHEDHFLCDRDGRPTRTHIVQSFCLQVQCGVHTSTATIMFGLAQHSAWEDKQQVRNEGGTDSVSPTQRAVYEHVSHKGGACGWEPTAQRAHSIPLATALLPACCHSLA